MESMKKKFPLILALCAFALTVSISACSSDSSSSTSGTADECAENPASPNCTTEEEAE